MTHPLENIVAAFDRAQKALAEVIEHKASNWKCGAARNLPISDVTGWDGPAAAEGMLASAGFNGDSPDPDKAKRGFLVYDAGNPKLKGSYKLPFARLDGGTLKATAGGLRAAASRLPQTAISAELQKEARAVLDGYMAKLKKD